MKRETLEQFRQSLLQLRQRLLGDVSHLTQEALRLGGGEASGSLSNVPLHMADLGTDNFEQEFTFGLLENQEQTLKEIGQALDRIDSGTYGLCEECGLAILEARLQALPYTRTCVNCARKMQEGT